MDLMLRRDDDGFHVVSGHMRLKAALSLTDEVKVTVPGHRPSRCLFAGREEGKAIWRRLNG